MALIYNPLTGLFDIVRDDLVLVSVNEGITAFAGGGQASATLLTKTLNEVSTVATAGDSVKLPTAFAGKEITVINNGANPVDVFPSTDDKINELAVNAAFSVQAQSRVIFTAYNSTNWSIIISSADFISGIDTSTQTFSSANTAQVVVVGTIIGSSGITSPASGEFLVPDTGQYKLIMFPILSKSVAATISHFLWLQKDTGSGFVDVADSNSETVLGQGETNDIRTITFVGVFSLNAGDKVRFMNSTTNTNLTLITKTPSAGNGPRIPSIIMSIDKLN